MNKTIKEDFCLTPLEENMTFDAQCWVAINTTSSEETEVVFFNPNQKENTNSEDIEIFEDFATMIFENHFSLNDDNSESQTDINPNKCTKSGCLVEEVEDYDEESGRVWKELHANAQIIDVYKNKNMEDIKELVKVAKKDLDNLEINSKESSRDQIAYQKDPYSYYGLNRNDF